MSNFLSSLGQAFSQLGTIRLHDIFDILIVAGLFYFIIRLIRQTKTNKLFIGVLIVLFMLGLSEQLKLYTVNYILRNAVQIGLLALVVLFQPEIRRALEKLGTAPIKQIFGSPYAKNADSAITQTVLACLDMSATKTGALIIFERDNRLDEQIRTGTIVNADITAELLKNIFYPKAPLHDGAVIIRSGRIESAGCMLPLSNNANLSKDLGMRHRAGIGMSEASDAVVVIVSEETGAISMAINGVFKRHLTQETFEKLLRSELLPEEKEETGSSIPLFRRKEKEKGNE